MSEILKAPLIATYVSIPEGGALRGLRSWIFFFFFCHVTNRKQKLSAVMGVQTLNACVRVCVYLCTSACVCFSFHVCRSSGQGFFFHHRAGHGPQSAISQRPDTHTQTERESEVNSGQASVVALLPSCGLGSDSIMYAVTSVLRGCS